MASEIERPSSVMRPLRWPHRWTGARQRTTGWPSAAGKRPLLAAQSRSRDLSSTPKDYSREMFVFVQLRRQCATRWAVGHKCWPHESNPRAGLTRRLRSRLRVPLLRPHSSITALIMTNSFSHSLHESQSDSIQSKLPPGYRFFSRVGRRRKSSVRGVSRDESSGIVRACQPGLAAKGWGRLMPRSRIG